MENRKVDSLSKIVNVLGLLIILSSIAVSIYTYTLGRSLWTDEAMLAYSVSQRSLLDLVATPLDNIQSAPILYLYIVKIIISIFGDSEFTLRVFSFISYILVLCLSFFVSRNIFKIQYPIIPVACISGLALIIKYSNEFKPYMLDVVAVLLVIIVYYLYTERKIQWTYLTVVWAILIWCSNPVCFFMATILSYEFVLSISHKEYTKSKELVFCGVGILISFLIYYFFWLQPVVDQGYMVEFWKWRHFQPPINSFNLKFDYYIIRDLFIPLGKFKAIIIAFCMVSGVFACFKIKNRYVNIVNLTFLLLIIISTLKMFPLQDRLCLFVYPLIVMLFFFYIDWFIKRKYVVFKIVISLLFLLSTNGVLRFLKKENVYFQEINMAVNYMDSISTPNTLVYIPNWENACQFQYAIDYDEKSLPYKVKYGCGKWWNFNTSELFCDGDFNKLKQSIELKDVFILSKYNPESNNPDYKTEWELLKTLGDLIPMYANYDFYIYKVKSREDFEE